MSGANTKDAPGMHIFHHSCAYWWYRTYRLSARLIL